jgi:hypothetical protein
MLDLHPLLVLVPMAAARMVGQGMPRAVFGFTENIYETRLYSQAIWGISMDDKKEVMEAIKTYGSLVFIGLLLPYIAGSILVSIGVINSVGVFEFSADAHATRYFAGLVSLMLASVVYLGGRYAIVLIVAYPLSVLLLGFGAIQNPTRNITDIDLIITLVVLILVTIAALPFIILIHFARKQKRKEVTYTSEPSKESDNQENNEDVVPQIVSFPTGKKIMTSVVIGVSR